MKEMIKRKDGSYSQRGLWDNIRANRGSGKKPTKEMLEQEAKIRAKAAYGMEVGGYFPRTMKDGGEPNGGMALGQMAAVADKMMKLRQFIKADDNLDPWIASKLAVMDHSADAISDYLMYGEDQEEEIEEEEAPMTEDELEEMKNGGIPERYRAKGFTKVGVKRKSTRPGKKWMVLAKKGDKYKIVHGGYKGMKDFTQHRNKNRQKKFWSRMGGRDSSKATDPFSPLYWHKRFGTWQDGGATWNDNAYYQNGGEEDFTKEYQPNWFARRTSAPGQFLGSMVNLIPWFGQHMYNIGKEMYNGTQYPREFGKPLPNSYSDLSQYMINRRYANIPVNKDYENIIKGMSKEDRAKLIVPFQDGGYIGMDGEWHPSTGSTNSGNAFYQMGGSAQQNQVSQIIQAYSQIADVSPEQIITQLKKMKPQDQQKALQQMMQAIQQSQNTGVQTPMMRQGGMPCYSCGGSYAYGGMTDEMGGVVLPALPINPYGLPSYNMGGGFIENPYIEDMEEMKYGGLNAFVRNPYVEDMMEMQDGGNPEWLIRAQLKAQGFQGQALENKLEQMRQGGIYINPKNKGKFTAKAKKAGMGVQGFAKKVLSAPEGRYSAETRRQANFARNAAGWKKQDGGMSGYQVGQRYTLTDSEIQALINAGYQIQYED